MTVRRQSLWVEIGLTLALLTVLVSVLDAGVFWLATRYVLSEANADLAESAATVVAGELAATDRADWKRVVDTHRRGGLRQLTVYDPQGAILAGTVVEADPDVRIAIATRQPVVDARGGDVQVVVPVGRSEAAVQVAIPSAQVARPAWGVVGAHALFSGAIIVVFGLYLFRQNVLGPIARMKDATQRIAGGEFGTTVPEDAATELAALAVALNRMSMTLKTSQDALVRSEKLASVGRLAAGLAHELGNPLTAVRGYVELLAGGGLPADTQKEFVERTGIEVERMHLLLRNLLDFARDEAREIEDVSVAELLEEATRTVRHQAAFRGVTIEIHATEGMSVKGETAKLHQVLVNLLLNAADADAKVIRLIAGGSIIEVNDDGAGIAPGDLPRLFEPFFTTRPPGMGTGLGLAIAHRVMEQHGGRLEVESAPGEGARFRMIFPGAG